MIVFIFISNNLDQLQRKLRRLKINVIPSLNLPKRKLDKNINTPTKEKIRKRCERAEKRSNLHRQNLFGTSNLRLVTSYLHDLINIILHVIY